MARDLRKGVAGSAPKKKKTRLVYGPGRNDWFMSPAQVKAKRQPVAAKPPKAVYGLTPTLPNRPKAKPPKLAPGIPVTHSVKSPAKLTTQSKPHAAGRRTVAPPRPVQHTALVRNAPGARSAPARTRTVIRTRSVPQMPMGPQVDPAQQYIDAAVNPQMEALDRLAAFQKSQQDQAAQRFQVLTDQYQGAISQIPGQVQADYDKGIQQQAILSKLSSDALAAANPQAQNQQLLQSIGAPEAQQQQVADKLHSAFSGGAAALQFLGGTIPGTQMSEDEAARLAFARALPAIAKQSGDQVLNQFLQKQAAANFDIQNQRANITSQIPKLLLDYQSQAASNKAKQAQLNLERRALGLKAQNQGFQQKVTTTKLAQSQQSLQLRALQSDRQWQATLKKLGLQTAGLKLKATQLELKRRNGGITAGQALKFRGTAMTIAENAHGGFTDNKGTEHRPLNWGEAIREMLKEGIPINLALPALRFYYKPGENGRPRKK